MASPMHDMMACFIERHLLHVISGGYYFLLQHLWFCLEMMVDNLFCFSNLHPWLKFKSTKNNYDLDKMTVVEIQGGSNY